jgi:hypothetical protein
MVGVRPPPHTHTHPLIQLHDVAMFLTILIVFMLAYATFAQSMQYPNRDFYWGIFGDILYYPWWQLYGEMELEKSIEGAHCFDSHPRCLQAKSTAVTTARRSITKRGRRVRVLTGRSR